MTAEPSESDESAPTRPELHLVRDTEPGTDTTDDMPAVVEAPAEAEVETTGPVPVLDADGNPVSGQPPWDVRIRNAALGAVAEIPAFGQVPASFAESFEYSQDSDWATSDSGAKRVAHGLATIVAYVGTYPFVEGLGKAREKPIALVLTIAVLIAVVETLTAVL